MARVRADRATLPAVAAGIALILMAGCSPQAFADKVTMRAAESVVLPVVSAYMTGPQAELATGCVIAQASADELQLLARDVAVEAGTSTVQTVLTIAARPEVVDCLAAAGVPALPD